ncbi:unnamed protein product [Didymodactylos carnosus]|uniref:J domain-containing protein n=1 Tax=Didymodactylos carnosus TaxID=1234261 RepID=A0A813QJ41_9BILA|nr:unnamed protein product [Didymodactylos carnosus]CAF1374596.1 unnamed protein product [Didymodactylos carnosus]CAF3550214.1 unnamed protein product [Didymodactylos carnosus]CAF4183516.1 unnamed protein product [Didymodactylos carnosus]
MNPSVPPATTPTPSQPLPETIKQEPSITISSFTTTETTTDIPAIKTEELFNEFYTEVLQIDPNLAFEDIAKQYRKLSMLVHPDKNPNQPERAQVAFEAVNKAYKLLEDEKERKKCLEVVDEAKERVEEMYKRALWSMTCKLFADIERLRVREEERKAEERKRKAEEKADGEEKAKLRKEWDKNYEESREVRVNSWKSFQTTAKTKTAAKGKPTTTLFKPPKPKPETR